MNNLKPCPFCGGEAKLCDNSISDCVYDPITLAEIDCTYEEPDTFWVNCRECYAMTLGFDTEKEAIEAWNKRG
jgi:hypothetical protein